MAKSNKAGQKKSRITTLIEIFLTFCKISPITFGGGYAMIPVLETEMVDKKKWLEKENIVDVFAVAQSVPGAIAVNSAIFLGYRLAGVAGAVAAMLGMVLPTFAIIIVMGALLVSFQNNTYVQAAFKGIRSVIVALIAAAAYRMGKVSLIGRKSWLIFLVSTAMLLFVKNLNMILLIILGAVAGILIVNMGPVIGRLSAMCIQKKIRDRLRQKDKTCEESRCN